jgi:hypothetical protein
LDTNIDASTLMDPHLTHDVRWDEGRRVRSFGAVRDRLSGSRTELTGHRRERNEHCCSASAPLASVQAVAKLKRNVDEGARAMVSRIESPTTEHAQQTMTPAGVAVRRHLSSAIAVAAAVLILTGCTAQAEPRSAASLRPTASPVSADEIGISNTCTVVSIVESNANNALVLKQQGQISADGYTAMVQPISVDLTVLSHREHVGFSADVKALMNAIPQDANGATSGAFTEEDPAYTKALHVLVAECADRGASVLGLDATGAG